MAPPLPRDDWARVLRLMDEALALAPEAREAWLTEQALPAPLEQTLRQMLDDRPALEAQAFMAEPVTPTDAGSTLGPWRLIRLVGEGGMASVWRAERADGAHERPVALKLPHLGLVAPGPRAKAFLQRFERERRILGALRHPHIAQLLDAGTSGGQPWLAMEFIEGETITEHARRHALPVPARLRLFQQVLHALQHAHAQLVIHRDLKPSNVLVDAQGRATLLDFGVAALLAPTTAADPATARTEQDATRLGGRAMTLRYASPEQLSGGALGTASDVYSAGVLLFELLTGASPYAEADDPGAAPGALQAAILEARVRRPSQAAPDAATARALRGDLDTLVTKALQRRPADRYASADAMAQDIERHLQRLPIHARAQSVRYRLGRWARRHAVLLVGGASTGLALCIGLGVALWQAREARAQRDEAQAQQRVAEAVQAFASDLLGVAGADGGRLSLAQAVDHAESVARHLYASQPEVLAELLMMVARKNVALQRPQQRQRAMDDAVALLAASRQAPLRALAACRAVPMESPQAAQRLAALVQALPDADPAYARARYHCHSYLATLLTWQGQAAQAQRHMQLSEAALAEQPPMVPVLQAEVLETRADIARGLGRAAEADEHYAQAIAAQTASVRGATLGTALLLNYRVLMQLALGRPATALAMAQQMNAMMAGMGAADAMPAYMHTNTGVALFELGRLDEAEQAFRRAIALAQAAQAPAFTLGAQGRLTELLLARGERARAEALARQREALDRRDPTAAPQGSSAVLAARLALARGAPAEAAATLDGLLPRLAANAFLRATEQQAWTLRAEAALALGDAPGAARAAREAVAVAERLGPGPSARAGRALLRLHAALRGQDAPAAQAAAERALQELAATLGPGHALTREAERAVALGSHADRPQASTSSRNRLRP